ncbi:MAG TPA: AAA family ATPase [Mobilitalea sp.]|nr:AAA family ATPase [Mobilitalea sp.]
MAKVIILCGKIASGKSFYANEIQKKTNATILSVDDLMLKLSDSCLGSHHDDMALRCEHYFYSLAEQIIGNDGEVIIDFGYWLRKEREEAKQYFNKRGITVELHYVNIPEDKRLEQLELRNTTLIKDKDNQSEEPWGERVYIIGEELRKRLDLKFEEPMEDEVDKLISGM